MPNRIIKERICKSRSINNLSWFEEVLFYRLIVVCDDYGRYDGDAAIIKGSCFPRKDVTLKQIEEALKKLSTEEMVLVYEYEGETYLQLIAWDAHQTVRAAKSKYPAFDDSCKRLYANEINCAQENTDESNCSRIRKRETINDIRNRNTETRHAYGEYNNVLLSDSDFEKLKSEFPGDYEQRIENLSSYIASKGKTYKNHLATIRNWARREAEQAVKPNASQDSSNPFLDMLREEESF